jgi:hypothetical protein
MLCKNFIPPTAIPTPLTFDGYIQSLPSWEQSLLTQATLLDTPHNIITELNSGPFNIGSDGSVIAQSASFGYVLAGHTKRRLIRGRGPAPGSRPQSFRAEAYGALAARRMLLQIATFTNTPLTSTFTHHIDNQSVISRDRKETQRTFHIPNSTLAPDWDVLSTLNSTNDSLPPNTTKWIRGHQDAKKDRRLLSHPAQLNCEADDEASNFQTEHPTPQPSAPLIPNTHAQLQIAGETINSYYKTRIREAATLPTYFAYLETKYDWTPTTRRAIDWSSYKQIIRKFRPQQITLVKHLHEIAPTGIIAHRNNHHHPASCPACECTDETNNHVLQCPSTTRSTWRSTVIRKVTNATTNSATDPNMSDILRDGLTRWLRCLPPPTTAHYPATYHLLINSQNQIGWDHLFRGRWSSEWKNCHRHYATRMSLTGKHSDSTRWVRNIGQLLIAQWFELWTTRNLERHGKDHQEQEAKRRQFLTSQLEELYSYRDEMLPLHRHILMQDSQTHLTQRPNLDGLETWLHTFGPAIHSSIKQAKAQAAARLALPPPQHYPRNPP